MANGISRLFVAIGAKTTEFEQGMNGVQSSLQKLSTVGKKLTLGLTLPIAGLLSPEPLDVVASQHEIAEKTAASLGNLPPAPFSILSFLALPVIPELRLTDLGLVDINKFKLIR